MLADLVLLGLATWRLTKLVQDERGPFAVLERIREALGIGHDADGQPFFWPDTELGRLLSCHWCGSVWAAIGLVGLYLLVPKAGIVLALPLALSALSIGWEEVVNGKGER